MDVESVDGLSFLLGPRSDQCLTSLRLFDDIEHGVAGVGRGLVTEIHARCEPDVDPTGGDPETDMRRHGFSAASSRDRTGLDRVDAVDAGLEIRPRSRPATEF